MNAKEILNKFLADNHISQAQNEVERGRWYDVSDTDHFYFLECFGVYVNDKSESNPQITFLVEDDGNWFVSSNNGFSVRWATEMQDLMDAVLHQWIDFVY